VSKQVAKVELKFKGHKPSADFGHHVVAAIAAALGLSSDEVAVMDEREASFMEAGSMLENAAGATQNALIGLENSNPTTTVTVGFVADDSAHAEELAAEFQAEWNKFKNGLSSRLSATAFDLPVDSIGTSSAASAQTVYQCSDGTTATSAAGCNVSKDSSPGAAGATKSAAGHIAPISSIFLVLLAMCVAFPLL